MSASLMRDEPRDHRRGRNAAAEKCGASRRRPGVAGARLHDVPRRAWRRAWSPKARPCQVLRQSRQDVEIAQDQRRLGHDADRMPGAIQHLHDAAHDPGSLLDRLGSVLVPIAIARLVIRRRTTPLQQRGRRRLHEQPGFESSPADAQVGVGRPGEAIDAAMFEPRYVIDGQRDVGRFIPGDDLAGGIDRHVVANRRQFLQAANHRRGNAARLVAARVVGQRAAATPALGGRC